MKKIIFSLLTSLFILGLIGINNSYSQTVIDRVPVTFEAFIPCANNGIGETAIAENAVLQFVSHVSEDTNGGLHIKTHTQPIQNWDMLGQVTGDEYQATGMTSSNLNFISNGESFSRTLYNNFRIIGPGPNNYYTVHVNEHLTINANGEVTVNSVNVKVDCN